MDNNPPSPIKKSPEASLAIPAADYPDARALAAQIEDEVRRRSATSDERQTEPSPVQLVEVVPAAFVRAMANVATNAWKLKLKMIEPQSGDVRDEFKRLYRNVENILASFSDIGIEIKDRTGEVFDYGLPEKVITTQERAGISKKLVIETVKPTIYYGGEILQCGEVIIATPEESKPLPTDAP